MDKTKKKIKKKEAVQPGTTEADQAEPLLYKRKARRRKHEMRTTFSVSTSLPKIVAIELAIDEGKLNGMKFVNDAINRGIDMVIESYGLKVPSPEETKKIIEEAEADE